MKRVFTAVAAALGASADQNSVQDRALGLIPTTKNQDFGAYVEGSIGGIWQASAGIATVQIAQIDDTFDWRDRLLTGDFFKNSNADQRAGAATDYNLDSTVAGAGFTHFYGYTGKGGYSTTAGAAVAATSPPTRGAAAFRSYYINAGSDVYLWADPTNGSLWIYNGNGFTIYPLLTILGTGKTGKRP